MRPSSAQATIERYGDRAQFLQTFAVVNQFRHVSAPERCVLGSAPTMSEVNAAYGRGTSEEWLVYQFTELAEYSGARDKISPWQIKQLARNFYSEYGWLKVTDIELYLHRLKNGAYGRFFGAVDPQQIMVNVKWYLEERNQIMADVISKQEQERREHMKDGTVTWDEYHEMNPDMKYNPLELMAEAARLQIKVTELLALMEEAERLQITAEELLKQKKRNGQWHRE